MEIKDDFDFDDLENKCWSGAKDTIKMIRDNGMEDEFMSFLESYFEDIPTLTEVNDLLWFDEDYIKENLGIKDWDELSSKLDSKAIAKAEKVFDKIRQDAEDDVAYDDEGNKTKVTDDMIEEWISENVCDYEDFHLAETAVECIESDVAHIIDDGEKTDDTDSMISAITWCGIEGYDSDFQDVVDMANDIDSWLSDNNVD